MSVWQMAGALALAYLVLLARSAWKQGEFRQYLRSLLIVAALVGTVAVAVMVTAALDGR